MKRGDANCFVLHDLSGFEIACFAASMDAGVKGAKANELNFSACCEFLPDACQQFREHLVVYPLG